MHCQHLRYHRFNYFIRTIVCVLTAIILNGCTTEHRSPPLKPTEYHTLAGWQQDNHTAIRTQLLQHCQQRRTPPITATSLGLPPVPAHTWQEICQAAGNDAQHSRTFFERYFTPYVMASRQNTQQAGHATGYFIPTLRASLKPDARYKYPIYPTPPASLRHLSRRDIDAGALLRHNVTPIAYTDDPVLLFFMQIQGSGYAQLPDGSARTLAFDGKNSQPYVAIGRTLIQEGYMRKEDVNYHSLLNWLNNASADKALRIMHSNPSYVFFSLQPAKDGLQSPIKGAAGVALTPMRSIAVDPAHVPLGLPVYINTTLPNGSAYNALTLAQDTGGAIKGSGRFDLFTGMGEAASHVAGGLNHPADVTLLYPTAALGNRY